MSGMTAWALLGIATTCVIGTTATVRAQPSIAQDVLSIHADLDNMCRGWAGNDPHIGEACDVRLKTEKLLGKLGYCYGTKSDFGPNGRGRAGAVWHKCTAKSMLRP
jgi:hypothetical protein